MKVYNLKDKLEYLDEVAMLEYDECELLAKTQGKISTDYFFVEEMDVDAIKDIKGTYVNDEEISIDR